MLNLGDVSIYATAAYLADILAADGYETRMVPGVTSFCAVAARLLVRSYAPGRADSRTDEHYQCHSCNPRYVR